MGKQKYVAFLRGINVGGHHKVPMVQLRSEMEKLDLENVATLLNTGNIIFEASTKDINHLEREISVHLENVFGFPIPTMIRKAEKINELIASDPFAKIKMTKDVRLYVSFVRQDPSKFSFPWSSDDGSYRVLDSKDKTVLSVLDLAISRTPKAMEALENFFGKDMTSRNWNTILRLGKKLESQ